MITSENEQVQKFLEEIEQMDEEKSLIILKLREMVFELFPGVNEKIMYGGIMFSLEKDWGGLFLSKKHVSFEFSNGAVFNDPKKILEGGGKFRRHLKFKSQADIVDKEVPFFIKQAV